MAGRRRTLLIALISIVGALLIVASTVVPLLILVRLDDKTLDRWSLIGQAVTPLSVLYSGLALFAIVFALLMQRRDLHNQREELAIALDEQRRSSEIALRAAGCGLRAAGCGLRAAGTASRRAGGTVAMPDSFAVTWDYRCPFARNAHEHVLTGLAGGADWDVRFVPFSLGQVHVAEGAPSVWDKPEQDSGIVVLQAGVVVRDEFPDRFPAVHRALFAARHDEGRHLEDREVVARVLADHGVPADVVFARIGSGAALATVRSEHEGYATSHSVWGVPTFISGDQAVFVRLMSRASAGADAAASIRTVDRIVDLVTGWVDLNEFKHTSVPR
jgi:DSBA-like thioredoxin domain